MKYCNYCQVYIRDNKTKCQLCGNTLSDDNHENCKEIYPYIPPAFERHLAIRIMLFISIIAVVVNFAIYLLFDINVKWPLFVLFGVVSAWISLTVVMRKRHNIPKTIMWQVAIVSFLSIFWDWRIGWIGWSLDYVIPGASIIAILVMYVTAKIMKLSVRDYIIYALIDGIFGIVPILFIVFKWVNVFYPSVVCAAISIIFLSAVFIFQGENIKIELDKRMHI